MQATDLTFGHAPSQRPLVLRGLRSFIGAFRQPVTGFALGILLFIAFLAIFAPLIDRYPPTEIAPGQQMQGPSAAHWLGTDDVGRDVYSRVIHGARVSLFVGISAVLLAGIIGWAIGIASAYIGGLVDLLLQRVIDAMMAFPTILLALALIAALGRSEKNVIIAIGLVIAPNVARIVRASTLTVREEMYVLAARSVGVTDVRIVMRHITPNIVGPLIVVATVALGGAIISEASLSFLGLGTPPPNPTWGSMIGGTARYKLEQAPWLIWGPGAALTLTVLATNVLGDSLRDRLDPRLRRR